MDAYLGRLYWRWNRESAARERFAAATAALNTASRGMTRREGSVRIWYGRFLTEKEELDRAEPILRRGLEMIEEMYTEDQWELAEARAALGICLVHRGNREEGLPLLQRGEEDLRRLRGPDHPMTLWAARAQTEAGL